MTKCVSCGEQVGLFKKKKVKIDNDIVCLDCLHSWGFDEADLAKDQYRRKSWQYLSKGKAAIEAEEARKAWEKEHHRYKRYILDLEENEQGKDLQKLVPKLLRQLIDSSNYYDGFTNSLLKEYGRYDERYYQFGADTYDCTLEARDGTLRVMFEGTHVGDLPEALPVLEAHPDLTADIMILGGKYKYLDIDDETDKAVVRSDETDYVAYVQLNWYE